MAGFLGRLWTSVVRPTSVPAAIAAVVVLLFGIYAERQNRQLFEERQRTEVLNEVSLIRARLEGSIRSNVQLVKGLAGTIATEPGMNQARFEELARNVVGEGSQIRNIAGAPDLVIALMYPLAGNEAAIGLDYKTHERQRETALRARDSGRLVMAGPMDLIQGGQGLIARLPVYYEDRSGTRRFWGIISSVMDVQRLYADSGLLNPYLDVDIAITGQDAKGALGARFLGTEEVRRDRPVKVDVVLPSGSWQMSARPKGGWSPRPDNIWLLRLAVLAAGILVVVPTFLTGRLVDERRENFARLREREADLERLSHRLELALDASKVGVWEYDLNAGELVWDDRMNELYGYPQDNGRRDYGHWRRRLDLDEADRAAAEFAEAIRTRGRYVSQYKIRLAGGQTRIIRAIGDVYVEPGGASRIIGVNWDVTADVELNEDLKRAKLVTDARNAELEAARARIEHNSLHDFLTGLPNRMYLDKVLEEHAARCARTGGGIVLLHVDLDRFKEINDTLGHAAGDAMLVHVATVIRASLGEKDFVARTGGDEFVIICPADDGMGSAEILAQHLIDAMQRPAYFDGHECRFGISVGIAGASGSAVDRQRLLVNADIALYRAKNLGRNRFEFFTEALQAEIVSNKQTADQILQGLEQAEFVPYFQPQFDARTFALVGVEALARWNHPQRGVLAPSEFVAIAEELNVLATIDRIILESGLAALSAWRDAGLSVPRLSVNVSFRRLHDEGLIASLSGLDFAPGTLAFELVESIYLDESDALVSSNIAALKTLGIDIEIDDFGTGYASIVSLTKLKPRRLKIDRQLVAPIIHSQAQRHLVQSIVDIGKSLGIEVVAEGVETMDHARLLRDLGCDVLQGFAFARPMSAGDLLHFVAGRAERAAS